MMRSKHDWIWGIMIYLIPLVLIFAFRFGQEWISEMSHPTPMPYASEASESEIDEYNVIYYATADHYAYHVRDCDQLRYHPYAEYTLGELLMIGAISCYRCMPYDDLDGVLLTPTPGPTLAPKATKNIYAMACISSTNGVLRYHYASCPVRGLNIDCIPIEEAVADSYLKPCAVCGTDNAKTAIPYLTPTPSPSPTPALDPDITAIPLPSGFTRSSIVWKDGDYYHCTQYCSMRYRPSDYGDTIASLLEGTGAKPCPYCCGGGSSITPRPTPNTSIDYFPMVTPRPTPKPTEKAYLYTTEYGDKYHRKSCGSLWNSCYGPYTLSQVIRWGYEPCQRCDP